MTRETPTLPLEEFEDGTYQDEKGNVYGKDGNLIKEAPSEELLEARKMHPDWTDEQLSKMVPIIRALNKARKRYF